MVNTENGSANKPATGDDIGQQSHIYDDEINLMSYFIVLWKHKRLILICSILPALIVALSVYLTPRSYVVTYAYDVKDDSRVTVESDVSTWNLNEKNLYILESRFYSEENINKIIGKLKKDGLSEYAGQVRQGSDDDSKRFVEFEVSSSFADPSRSKATGDKLGGMDASLLKMKMTGKPKEDIVKGGWAVNSSSPLFAENETICSHGRCRFR